MAVSRIFSIWYLYVHTIGKKVRKTIQEIGGTMPEELPSVENIKLTEKRIKSSQKKWLSKK